MHHVVVDDVAQVCSAAAELLVPLHHRRCVILFIPLVIEVILLAEVLKQSIRVTIAPLGQTGSEDGGSGCDSARNHIQQNACLCRGSLLRSVDGPPDRSRLCLTVTVPHLGVLTSTLTMSIRQTPRCKRSAGSNVRVKQSETWVLAAARFALIQGHRWGSFRPLRCSHHCSRQSPLLRSPLGRAPAGAATDALATVPR